MKIKLKKVLAIVIAFTLAFSNINANTIIAETTGETGDFTVSGGILDLDYSYSDSVLTILTSTELTISGTTTTDYIVVASGVEANLIISNLSIDLSDYTSGVYCPISFTSAGVSTITLVGINTLIAGWQSPGILVPNGYLFTIQGDGELTARGATYWPGIGRSGNNGNILITGGTITANGGDDGASGIGGSNGSGAGTITITGGTITAIGGPSGAGIGGGVRGSGGTITISGGTINATAGSNAYGIGGGYYSSSAGSFSTGENGTAIITTTSIADKSNIDEWSSLVIIGSDYVVYGDIIITEDLNLTSGQTLTIYDGATLTVSEDVTLSVASGASVTVEGTLVNEGTVSNEGTITIYNEVIGTEVTGTGSVYKEITMDVYFGQDEIEESLLYDEEYTLTSVFSFSNPVTLDGADVEGVADVYINNNVVSENVSIIDNVITYTVNTADSYWKLGANSIKVTYSSANDYGNTDKTIEIYVRDDRTIDAPIASSISAMSIVLGTTTPSSGGDSVYYGYSLENDEETVSNWQTSTTFDNLEPGETYYFFTKVNMSDEYLATNSSGTQITTSSALTELPTSLSINDGSISIADSSKEGIIYVIQGSDVYEIDSTTEIIVTGTGTSTSNTVTVDGASANVTLKDVSIEASWFGSAVTLKNGANVTLTLEGDNIITCYNSRESAAITVPDGTALTIEGEGSLVIGSTDGRFEVGIGNTTESFDSESGLGQITINSGTVAIYSYWIAIGINYVSEDSDSSIAINGGEITADAQYSSDGSIKIGGSTQATIEITGGDITSSNGVVANTVIIGGSEYTVDTGTITIQLDEDTTLPNNTIIIVDGFSIEVPNGATLTAEGTILLEDDQILTTIVDGETVKISTSTDSTSIAIENGSLVLSEGAIVTLVDGTTQEVTGEGMVIIPDVIFTITFNTTGGSEVSSVQLRKGEYVTEPEDPTLTGYLFEGWYSDELNTTLWDFEADVVSEDVTLYAGWKEWEEYNVISDEAQKIVVGEEKTITFSLDADANDFVGLYFAGVLLEPTCYDVFSGSTIIVLNESFISNLLVGEYELLAEFMNGYSNISLTVLDSVKDTSTDQNENLDDAEVDGDTNQNIETDDSVDTDANANDDLDSSQDSTPDTHDLNNSIIHVLGCFMSMSIIWFSLRKKVRI